MYYLCTYFDVNYLPRAIAMYYSLIQHCKEFRLFMLCFDDESFFTLKGWELPQVTLISQKEFESGDDELIATKKNRTQLEYYFTCTPSLPLFIFNNYKEVDLITYVDADIFFFSSIKPLFDEMKGYSIGITVHNFPECRKKIDISSVYPAKTGIYNVGWLSFRRDVNGLACLKWWRERCIEWCYLRYEDDRCADQKYLDQWLTRFQGVHILVNRGANVAPWNVNNYNIYEENGVVYVDNYPLVFFHFHGFKQISKHIYDSNLGLTFSFPSNVVKERIFAPYIIELIKHSLNMNLTRSLPKGTIYPRWIRLIRKSIRILIGLVFRQYLLFLRGKIY